MGQTRIVDADKWNKTVKEFPESNFLQSPSYGRMNEILGAKVITEDFGGSGGRSVPAGGAGCGRALYLYVFIPQLFQARV